MSTAAMIQDCPDGQMNIYDVLSADGKMQHKPFNVDLPSPIAGLLRKYSKADKLIFEKFSLLPFWGTRKKAENGYLRLFDELSLYSASARACISGIEKAAFGGSILTVETDTDGYDTSMEPVESDVLKNYLKQVGITGHVLRARNRDLYRGWASNGNAYLYVNMKRIAGTERVNMEVYMQKKVYYLDRKNPFDPEQVLITDKLDPKYWRDNPPLIADVWSEDYEIDPEADEVNLVFHFGNFLIPGLRYGLPASIACMFNKYNEWQNADYLTRETSAGLVGRLFVFLKDPNFAGMPNIGRSDHEQKKMVDDLSRGMNQTTIRGSKIGKAIGVMSVPDEVTTVKLDPNTNEKWYTAIQEYNAAYIYSCYGYSTILSSLRRPNSSLSQDIVGQEIRKCEILSFAPTRNEFNLNWQKVYGAIYDWRGAPDDIRSKAMAYASPYGDIIENLKFGNVNGSEPQTPQPDPDE